MNQTTRRAVRLATMAVMLRDGHRLTMARCRDMFGVSERVARLDLEAVGTITPTHVTRMGRQIVYTARKGAA